jgi:predicted nucleotidyltransferase
LIGRWPVLDELCRCAESLHRLEVWVFGSMLRSDKPRDLDVLVIYNDPVDLATLRRMGWWEISAPQVDIIAMTPDEEHHYRFIEVTGAIRLLPQA